MSRRILLTILAAALAGAVIFRLTRLPDEVDLAKYEHSIFSQGGEDGVLAKIFELIEPTNRFAVEFGCADGVRFSNVRHLIADLGWSGLLMDGDSTALAKAVKAYERFPRATILEAWVYPGNVETLFEKHGVPRDLDLLVIDIDSNDYYVWSAIHDFRPKVVLIEYNANFPPPQKAVINFHPLNYWDGSDYFGASIQSLYELGKRKGYELVYGTQLGINLVFVDQQYYRRFGIRDNSPARFYHPPGYGVPAGGRAPNGRGHPRWDTFEQVENGMVTRPFDKPLTWEKVEIPKKFVELP